MNLTLTAIAFALALFVAYIAFRAGMLDRRGAAAAAALGTIVFGLGGWQWAVLLLSFFLSSSVLSKAFKSRKHDTLEVYSKGDRRDAAQVAANGGLAALFVGAHLAWANSDWPWIGFAASLAAANADTWATELGALSRTKPRLITNLSHEVEPGSSGAISITGTLAALGGAAAIAMFTAWLDHANPWISWVSVSAGGFIGCMADSLLGATKQAIYVCPRENRETEQHPLHSCGSPTILVRGWGWLNNDWVNVFCTVVGALIACALVAVLATT